MNGYELVRLQPNQVKKSGDTMTGDLTMNGGKFVGDLQGKLATPRNIKVGNAIRQFDGSRDIEFPLNEIGVVGGGGAGGTINTMSNYKTTINTGDWQLEGGI